MTKTIYISRKKSGTLTITDQKNSNWDLVKECISPKELKEAVNSFGYEQIITAEYNRSQNKVACKQYTSEQALKAFGLQKTNDNLAKYF